MITILYIFSKYILWLSHGLACEILILARSSQAGNSNLFGWICIICAVGKRFQNSILIPQQQQQTQSCKMHKIFIIVSITTLGKFLLMWDFFTVS